MVFGIENLQNKDEGVIYIKKAADLGNPNSMLVYALIKALKLN